MTSKYDQKPQTVQAHKTAEPVWFACVKVDGKTGKACGRRTFGGQYCPECRHKVLTYTDRPQPLSSLPPGYRWERDHWPRRA